MLWLGLALSLAGGTGIHSGIQVTPAVGVALPVGHELVVAEGICVVATLAQVTEGIGQVRRDDGGVPPPLDQVRRDDGGVPPPSPSSIV